jgi:hypothetical protein
LVIDSTACGNNITLEIPDGPVGGCRKLIVQLEIKVQAIADALSVENGCNLLQVTLHFRG